MSQLDSRITNVEPNQSPYTNSNPASGSWGQPPASYFQLDVNNGILIGQLVHNYINQRLSSISEEDFRLDRILQEEISAWEMANIEDLLKFESSL